MKAARKHSSRHRFSYQVGDAKGVKKEIRDYIDFLRLAMKTVNFIATIKQQLTINQF